jgi:hypothetical protein
MSNGHDYGQILKAARDHYNNLKTDIANASNRIEHIRLSALAQEAHNLLTELQMFEIGLVYTHTGSTEAYFAKLQEEGRSSTDESDLTLDLPEFKSPFNPDVK